MVQTDNIASLYVSIHIICEFSCGTTLQWSCDFYKRNNEVSFTINIYIYLDVLRATNARKIMHIALSHAMGGLPFYITFGYAKVQRSYKQQSSQQSCVHTAQCEVISFHLKLNDHVVINDPRLQRILRLDCGTFRS